MKQMLETVHRSVILRLGAWVLVLLVFPLLTSPLSAQDVAKLDRETQDQLRQVVSSLSSAMREEDEAYRVRKDAPGPNAWGQLLAHRNAKHAP